jgi:alpha-N-arabinofuranosidase
MGRTNRRDFLAHLISSGAVLTGAAWLRMLGYAQARGPARVVIDPSRVRAEMDRRVLGAFLEHLGRAIYTGVYDPESKFADANGFRKDVIAEVAELGVPIMRYPGGNFVSGYDWLHGVGPKERRPTVLERAWNSIETNQFGTNEFIQWCKLVRTEPLLATNLGTGTPETSAALAEYCNVEKGTRWSDLRREHGYEKPHNVKYWCLGNEMDGPWQIGHMPAREYGRKARDAARQMRVVDRNLQLIACGSSSPAMRTYLVWDREVLEECYDQVDAISLHAYYGNTEQQTGRQSSRYVGLNLDMEKQIHEVAAVCDYVQGLMKSPKRLWLSFDEWNVWYRARGGRFSDGDKKFAPPLLEEVYNLEDALLVGGFVNTLLRQSARVRIGCLAQIINVIAPLMTNADRVLRQTIYYPYAWALKYAHGNVLDLLVESDSYEARPPIGATIGPPRPESPRIPYLDAVATLNPANGQAALFLLNRDLEAEREVTVEWRDPAPTRLLACHTLTGPDLKATNTFADPKRVVPQALDAPQAGARMTFKLPARSYTVAHLATRS